MWPENKSTSINISLHNKNKQDKESNKQMNEKANKTKINETETKSKLASRVLMPMF